MRQLGKIGIDIHKKERPQIPESVGLAIGFALLLLLAVGLLFAPNSVAFERLSIMLLILLLVTLIGIYDDFKTLSGVMKPGILVIISLPILFWQVGDPRPMLPIVGHVRLTVVYYFMAVLVVSVTSNASNMLDVLNGTMSGTGIIIAATAFLTSFIIPLDPTSDFIVKYGSLTLLGALAGFWWFNKYPAKVFAGDTGSLVVGAMIGLLAIYGEIEFVLIVALLIHIMNSFSILGSIGGLVERRQMKARPVEVRDGIIYPNKDPEAPLTLVRLLVARRPKTEREIIKDFYLLVGYTAVLALVTAFVIKVSL